MKEERLTVQMLEEFQEYLVREEKSPVTIEKYVRDTKQFMLFAAGRPVTKELVVEYKKTLMERGYQSRSINSMLASVNGLLEFLGLEGCRVKSIRIQREAYSRRERELSKQEYLRMVQAAKSNPRLCLLLQTICGTGIRVSELSYFTVENVKQGEICVYCKSKCRRILVPRELRKKLLHYAKKKGIGSGAIFCTKSGRPMDRSNIWAELKKLGRAAGVSAEKVFPHNLRKLFARTFYGIEKDIAKLADILGHGSIDTTRIYIMTTGKEHLRKLERLGLVV